MCMRSRDLLSVVVCWGRGRGAYSAGVCACCWGEIRLCRPGVAAPAVVVERPTRGARFLRYSAAGWYDTLTCTDASLDGFGVLERDMTPEQIAPVERAVEV